MDKTFWRQAWREERIGFHRSSAHTMLVRHWSALGLPSSMPVLVPLCGKSLDMIWLRERGHPVTGVELSERALAQFGDDNALELKRTDRGWTGQGYELLAGDWFSISPPSSFSAFYDRGALVALPPPQRSAYVHTLRGWLRSAGAGLLISFEYDPAAMEGPPFSVPADEVRRLFSEFGSIEELERVDALANEPGFAARGLERMHEVAWAIRFLDTTR